MAPAARTVWRASPRTLVVIVVFALVAGVGVLAGAVVTVIRGESWPVPTVLAVVGVASLGYAWRFGLHPRLIADDSVVVRNPLRTTRIPWTHLTGARPGENGLVLERRDGPLVEAWCVQTSNRAQRHGRAGRAADIATTLLTRARMETAAAAPLVLRPAAASEAEVLTAIERSANLVALAHVFPPTEYAYPCDDVRQRWERLLADDEVEVVLGQRGDDPVGVIAYGDGRIRHLAVRAEQAGTGVGSALLEAACDDLFDDPSTRELRLWVLVANTRARSFYAGRGWSDGDARRTSEFPPHPEEMEMLRPNPRAARRGR